MARLLCFEACLELFIVERLEVPIVERRELPIVERLRLKVMKEVEVKKDGGIRRCVLEGKDPRLKFLPRHFDEAGKWLA